MKRIASFALVCSVLAAIPAAAASVPAAIIKPNYPAAATARDGSHDFDFEFGTWRTH